MRRSFPARVVSVGKNAAWVVLDDEERPRIADLKRASSASAREMVVPGDRVEAHAMEDGRVLIDAVQSRSSTLQRRSVRGRAKTMAANIDAIVTVTSLAQPPPRTLILDQLLAFAELEDLRALTVFTKSDLAGEHAARELPQLYRGLNYSTIVVNPKTGQNVEQLRLELAGLHAMLCGVSGVGKSSIFRALGGESAIGSVSSSGAGRQTTTAARLYRLSDGFLIDSPGVAEFGLGRIEPGVLTEAFREMREPARNCRFRDCSHLREPDCAVAAAVHDGTIAPSRYASYRLILGTPVG